MISFNHFTTFLMFHSIFCLNLKLMHFIQKTYPSIAGEGNMNVTFYNGFHSRSKFFIYPVCLGFGAFIVNNIDFVFSWLTRFFKHRNWKKALALKYDLSCVITSVLTASARDCGLRKRSCPNLCACIWGSQSLVHCVSHNLDSLIWWRYSLFVIDVSLLKPWRFI